MEQSLEVPELEPALCGRSAEKGARLLLDAGDNLE
jgi:hypothetical protein